MEVYKRIAQTRGSKRAIVGVARRFAGKLRSCIKKGVFYEIKHLEIKDANIEQQVSRDLVQHPVA
jgi:hypothetical protein